MVQLYRDLYGDLYPELEGLDDYDYVGMEQQPPERRPRPRMRHVHEFENRVMRVRGHIHFMSGVTSAVSGGQDDHRHQYSGWTTTNAGHRHAFCGVTGPAIPLRGGGHTHELMGDTSYDFDHSHGYSARTSDAIRDIRVDE